MNHTPPHTERRHCLLERAKVAASAEGGQDFVPGGALLSAEGILSSGPDTSGPARCKLEEAAHQGLVPPAPALPSGLAFYSLVLLKIMGANSAVSPSWHHGVFHLLFPQSSLAEGGPSHAWLLEGLSRRFMKEGSEKEKPLKIFTCPVYAIKGHKKGTQLAVNNFLQLFTDVQENYTLQTIKHE